MPKIISFYILNQLLKTLLITFFILFGILFFNESIGFLEKASNGELYPSLVGLVLIFSIPSLLEIAIPTSLFIGTLIAIYNLKKTNEITFANQAGLSESGIVLICLIPSIFLSIFLIFNSFFLAPTSNQQLSFLSKSQSFADNFKLMGEGKINEIEELNGIFFAEGASDLGFQNIFAKIESEDLNYILNSEEVSANSNDQIYNKILFKNGELFIPLEENNFFLDFESLFFLFPKNEIQASKEIKSKTWNELLKETDNQIYVSEILERFSLGLMLIISVMIAAPLSLRMQENGRFILVFSGLVIFLSYYGLVIGQKAFIEENIFKPMQIFLIIHGLFAMLAIFLFGFERFIFNFNSVIAKKYSKKWFLQLLLLVILVSVIFNIIFYEVIS